MSEYIENGYPEKLFYYCLRKTGDVREAEDLASDISLSVIQELSRGVVPQSFSAWVWKMQATDTRAGLTKGVGHAKTPPSLT